MIFALFPLKAFLSFFPFLRHCCVYPSQKSWRSNRRVNCCQLIYHRPLRRGKSLFEAIFKNVVCIQAGFIDSISFPSSFHSKGNTISYFHRTVIRQPHTGTPSKRCPSSGKCMAALILPRPNKGQRTPFSYLK